MLPSEVLPAGKPGQPLADVQAAGRINTEAEALCSSRDPQPLFMPKGLVWMKGRRGGNSQILRPVFCL